MPRKLPLDETASPAYVRTDLACESHAPAVTTAEETVGGGSLPVTLTRRPRQEPFWTRKTATSYWIWRPKLTRSL